MAAWQNPEYFARWLAFILLLAVVFVVVFVVFTRLYFRRLLEEQQKLQTATLLHQQALLQASVQVQERERERIAADLHDDLISRINVALLSLHTQQPLEQVSDLLQDSMKLARRISHDLSPPLLEQSSLYELLEAFVSPLEARVPIRLTQAVTTSREVEAATKLQLLRMVQEVINNALKYAQAECIRLHLHHSPTWVGVLVEDDGVGFDAASSKPGLGQQNIALRSQLLDGRYRLRSALGKGCRFVFYAPIKNTTV